jgi:hypothetical protein
MIQNSIKNPDLIGILASSLCLIHCLITPFLFLSNFLIMIRTSGGEHEALLLWKVLEFAFLILSFWAIHRVTHQKKSPWISFAMYTAWMILVISVLLELADVHFFEDQPKYMAAAVLIIVHLYHILKKHRIPG